MRQAASESHPETETRLIPLTEWPKYHPWPPIGGLRHLAFNAPKNGFDKVICRCGRRILINEVAFFEWAQNGNKQEQRDKIKEQGNGK